jgi:DNA-binding transcriptional regulator YiaG
MTGKAAGARDLTARERLAALSSELKRARHQRGDLPQELLATRLGVVTTSVANWEAGRDDPSAPHWMEWSRELGRRVAITDSDGNEILAVPGPGAMRREPHAYRELRRMSTVLRAVRVRRRLPQEALAAKLGVNRRSVIRWESVEGYPRPTGYVHWALALGCDVHLLPA